MEQLKERRVRQATSKDPETISRNHRRWLHWYRTDQMTNHEFQRHLQHDIGFLEHVEKALKDR